MYIHQVVKRKEHWKIYDPVPDANKVTAANAPRPKEGRAVRLGGIVDAQPPARTSKRIIPKNGKPFRRVTYK
jgi:hypothetical protein